MSVHVTGAPKQHWGRPDSVGPGRQRKVAIIGSHSGSILFAPYIDPTWEIWAHSSAAQLVPKGRADRLYDVHPPHCFTVERKNGFIDYYQYLKDCKTPVYMKEVYPEIPASRRYPYELVRSLWPGKPIGSQTALMIAHAIVEGVTELGFWGVHYSHRSDLLEARANCEHWIGIAEGRGIRVIIPEQSPLCHEPREIYAYETHATPEKYAARLKQYAEDMTGAGGLAPKAIERCDTPEELRKAAETRCKDPNWVRAMRGIPPHEAMPQWLLDQEAGARLRMGLPPLTPHLNPADDVRIADGLRESAADSPAVEGLPGRGAGAEGTASESRVAGRTATGDAARPPAGSGAQSGDGVVQPRVPAVPTQPARGRRPADHRQSTRRATVAGTRRAAGSTGASGRKRRGARIRGASR